jgi:TPR repeat protein
MCALGLPGSLLSKNIEQSIQILSPLAQQQHALSQFTLGKILLQVKECQLRGVKLLEMAAESGVQNAFIELGSVF